MKRFAPAPHSRLGNTSETIADADKGGAKRIVNGKLKVRVFSRQRKYIRQTNGISDQARSLPVRTDSNAHGASASPHACLRYTSGAVAGAIVVKENVFFVGATTGRPLLRSVLRWRQTRQKTLPYGLRGTMRSGIGVTEGGRRRTNIRGGVRRCEKGDIKNAMPKIVDKAGRVW